jgi:2,3-bisphosphoglycerate-independent phosphoglycerate mutase
MKKILYTVLDGLGDLPITELDNKTPLQSACTPQMDNLAKTGRTGILYPVDKTIAPESDIAVISLLGYDAKRYYTGRGPLESFAESLNVAPGNLALRINFATVDKDGRAIIDRRVGRNLTTDEATALAKEINAKVSLSSATFEFKNTIGHRGVLVIRHKNKKLSGWITNTDPAYTREGIFGVAKEIFENRLDESHPMEGYEHLPEAKQAADLLNEFTRKSHQVLSQSEINQKRISQNKLPGNIILSRDAGDHLPEFPSVKSLYNLRFGSFVQMPVEKGIALLTGMEVVEVPLLSGDLEVDYSVWAKIALKKIIEFDGLYIHIKGPDEPAHDGDFIKKKEIIEKIDKFFFNPLLKKLNLKDTIVAVTADHSTVCKVRAHTADPVPLLISGNDVVPDGSPNFSERVASSGSLGQIRGFELLPLLIKFAQSN